MKMSANFLVCLSIALLGTSGAVAQTGDSVLHKQEYLIILKQYDQAEVKGILYEADKTGVDLLNFQDTVVHIYVPAENISQIKYRKIGTIKRRLLLGAAIGAATGAAIGFATYDAHPCGFNTCVEKGIDPITTTVVGMIAGAGIGAILGVSYRKVNLYGDSKRYLHAISRFSKK